MENKYIGWLLLGVSALIIVVIFLFRSSLINLVDTTCPLIEHGYSCPAYTTITQQSYLAFAIVALLVVVAIVLILSKPREKIIIQKVKENEKKKKIAAGLLRPEERAVLSILQAEGPLFQADLIEKSSFSKVKMSRILDRLEARNIIERKRRGMMNIVVLK